MIVKKLASQNHIAYLMPREGYTHPDRFSFPTITFVHTQITGWLTQKGTEVVR